MNFFVGTSIYETLNILFCQKSPDFFNEPSINYLDCLCLHLITLFVNKPFTFAKIHN